MKIVVVGLRLKSHGKQADTEVSLGVAIQATLVAVVCHATLVVGLWGLLGGARSRAGLRALGRGVHVNVAGPRRRGGDGDNRDPWSVREQRAKNKRGHGVGQPTVLKKA